MGATQLHRARPAPGMSEEMVAHRTAVLRRGATVCFTLGGILVVMGIAAPFL